MNKNPQNDKIDRMRLWITSVNAIVFGVLYSAKEMQIEHIIESPFLSALTIALNIFVSRSCTELTYFMVGFHITNACLMIANSSLFLQIYGVPKLIS